MFPRNKNTVNFLSTPSSIWVSHIPPSPWVRRGMDAHLPAIPGRAARDGALSKMKNVGQNSYGTEVWV